MVERFLTLEDAADRVRRSRRTVERWVDAGELKVTIGRVRESELLATEKRMRERRGRPRKSPIPVAEPVAIVTEAIGNAGTAAVAVAALRAAGILPDAKT